VKALGKHRGRKVNRERDEGKKEKEKDKDIFEKEGDS
jgi:hypothetical protein